MMESTSTHPGLKNCPDCAEEIQRDARVCRYCGYRENTWQGEPADTTRILWLGAIAAVATVLIPFFGIAAFLAGVVLAVRGRVLAGAAIIVTSAIAFSVWTAAVSDAQATRSCGRYIPPDYFAATHIRADHLVCSKARRVTRTYLAKAKRNENFPRYVRPSGMGRFRCRYELHTVTTEDGGDFSYGVVRCRHTRRSGRLVRFRVNS